MFVEDCARVDGMCLRNALHDLNVAAIQQVEPVVVDALRKDFLAFPHKLPVRPS